MPSSLDDRIDRIDRIDRVGMIAVRSDRAQLPLGRVARSALQRARMPIGPEPPTDRRRPTWSAKMRN